MFNRAVEWDVVKVNPVSGIRPYPSKRHAGDQDINYFSQSEATRLLGWLEKNDPWLYPKVRVLLNTGLRIGEMVALRIADLKFSEKGWCLTVSRTHCRLSGQIRSTTKGGHARLVSLPQRLGESLSQLNQGKEAQEPLLFSDWSEYKGQTKFNKRFRKALNSAGVRKIRVHDMRHTFAVHFLENGGHLYDLQKLLGHQSSQLTERYSHFSLAMSERARGLVDLDASPALQKPRITVIDGGLRSAMSHKCPTDTEFAIADASLASH
jgi:integrase